MKTSNSSKIASAIRTASKRGYDAETLDEDSAQDLGAGWQSVAKGLGHIKSAAYISRGFAEDELAIIEGTKGFEVGTGESLRPYLRHYRGPSEDTAVRTFLNKALTDFPDPRKEEPEM